jgi:UDP-glucose 4-epimerase
MNLKGKRFLCIGGAGLIGSHTVDELLKEDVSEIRIYDNFTRGSKENIAAALHDPRVTVFPLGGGTKIWSSADFKSFT